MHTYVRRALQAALVTGGLVAAGASTAHAGEPVDVAGGTAATAAALAETGWAPWVAFAGVCLIALGVGLRRVTSTRRSTKSPFTHPALLNHVPTQRGEPRAR